MRLDGNAGFLRVYRKYLDEGGQIHFKLMGRIVLSDDNVHVIEDHGGIVGRMFPEGPVRDETLRRIEGLVHSAYWDVVSEEDIHDGHRPELMES